MASETRVTGPQKQNILKASGWMLGLSVGLVWLPLIGPLIAGFVGGRKAGGVIPALIAVFLPGLLLYVITMLLGGILVSIPVLGALFVTLFGTAGWLVSFMRVGPLVLGAILGGWSAD